MSSVLNFIAFLLLLATLIPVSKQSFWWVRILDFPRLQIAFLSAVVALLLFLFPSNDSKADNFVQLLLLLATSYQIFWIYPYLSVAKTEVENIKKENSENTIRLLTANVLQTNENKQGLLNIVEKCDPDIIVTLESDKSWEIGLESLGKTYTHTISCPLDNLYGMHVYSKLKLVNPETSFLVEEDIPSMHCEIELPDCPNVQAHFLHPQPPVPQYNESTDDRDAELIIVAKSIAGSNKPCIVSGDLNDVTWSTTTRLFRKISGLLDPRIGRGLFNSFHAGFPLIRWPLDHVFHSAHFSVVKIARLGYFGSDHFPLFVELGFTKTKVNENGGLSPSTLDNELAEEKISKRDVSVSDVPGD